MAEAVAVIAGYSSLGVMVGFGLYDLAIVSAAVECILVVAIFRPRRLVGWIPALIVTVIWIFLSGDEYRGYNVFRWHVYGIAIFPIIAWPTAFAFGYAYLIPLFRSDRWYWRWLRLSLAYSLGIIVLEWAGYNLLGIHLDAGLQYKGWPILNIFHCPWWMQVAYFVNGIAYMGMVSWMDAHMLHLLPTRRRKPGAGASESVPDSQTA